MEDKINIAKLLKCFSDEVLVEELQKRNYDIKKHHDDNNNLSDFNKGYIIAFTDMRKLYENWCKRLEKQLCERVNNGKN